MVIGHTTYSTIQRSDIEHMISRDSSLYGSDISVPPSSLIAGTIAFGGDSLRCSLAGAPLRCCGICWGANFLSLPVLSRVSSSRRYVSGRR